MAKEVRTIQELIKALQDIYAVAGDLPVYYYHDEFGCVFTPVRVYVDEEPEVCGKGIAHKGVVIE